MQGLKSSTHLVLSTDDEGLAVSVASSGCMEEERDSVHGSNHVPYILYSEGPHHRQVEAMRLVDSLFILGQLLCLFSANYLPHHKLVHALDYINPVILSAIA